MTKKKNLSNVVLMPAVEGISRKLALRREKCVDQSISRGQTTINIPGNTYMGIVSKVKNVFGYGNVRTNTLFMRKNQAAIMATSDQTHVRISFVAANSWVKAAQKDLNAITTNQLRFIAAKNDLSKTIKGVSARGYQTMSGWMKAIAFAIDNNHETLPVDHVLPDFDA